jgi:DNA (cytosine-5)-methyltransferase 1
LDGIVSMGTAPREDTRIEATPRLYSLVDLFAGCGGLSLGLENAGFTPVFVNELSPDAMATYLANRHHELGGAQFSSLPELHCRDAHDLTGARLDELKSDLAALPEVAFAMDTARAASGGGSNIDILAGGPPCQGFSGIGHRRSYSVDKRELPSNRLYVRMANVIRALRPRLFLFENVRGLLNSRWTAEGEERIWPDVLAEYRSIPGYVVRWKLVHAKDYGVPQNRPRVLLVGIRKDVLERCPSLDPAADEEDAVKCGFLPAGEPSDYPHLEDLLGDLVDPWAGEILASGKYPSGPFATTAYPRDAATRFERLMREGGPGKFRGLTDHEYSKHARPVVAKFMYMLQHGGRIPAHFATKKFSQRLLPPRWGNRGPTITATSLPDDYVHYAQPRILTVREWARLQLFPDWYQFSGKRTTGGLRRAGNPRVGLFDREVPKYTQIGNAVPVGLAERVGRHFRLILDTATG